jgi:transposase
VPRPHPPEFRQRAVELARLGEKPVSQIAQDLGISDSCLRSWLARADRDEGRRTDGLTSAERDELVKLRRELRVAKLEVEILKRAAAYFASENVLPK